ncbi:MAG: adenine phosphoribosyltransferase [Verrucomicrobia bacterium]|nr:adenine phosphoribosyltransferase [Verrucomicrobiota bacterium]
MSLLSKLSIAIAGSSLLIQPLAASASRPYPVQEGSLWLLDYILTTPDFPKAGIQFKSYGPLLKDPAAFKRMIQEFADRYRSAGIEAIAGLDARGFIFGTALAYELDIPFVMVRKAGKLPGDVEQVSYELEYGKSTLEIDKSILSPGQRVLVMDDLMATGGTAKAACELVEKLGAEVVEVACLIELTPLGGREKVGRPVYSLITIHVDE